MASTEGYRRCQCQEAEQHSPVFWNRPQSGGRAAAPHKIGHGFTASGGEETLWSAVAERSVATAFTSFPLAAGVPPALLFPSSVPLKSTYPNEVPLGPIMELRVTEENAVYTPERLTQTVDFWRNTTQQLLADPEAPEGSNPRKAYSHMAAAQGNLLADHARMAEAERLFRLALDLSPESPEGNYRLAELLARTGRPDEARQLLTDFARKNPAAPPLPDTKAIISSGKLSSPYDLPYIFFSDKARQLCRS